jgi:hypothetical protein
MSLLHQGVNEEDTAGHWVTSWGHMCYKCHIMVRSLVTLGRCSSDAPVHEPSGKYTTTYHKCGLNQELTHGQELTILLFLFVTFEMSMVELLKNLLLQQVESSSPALTHSSNVLIISSSLDNDVICRQGRRHESESFTTQSACR